MASIQGYPLRGSDAKPEKTHRIARISPFDGEMIGGDPASFRNRRSDLAKTKSHDSIVQISGWQRKSHIRHEYQRAIDLTYWRSAADPLAGGLEAPASLPNTSMERLETAFWCQPERRLASGRPSFAAPAHEPIRPYDDAAPKQAVQRREPDDEACAIAPRLGRCSQARGWEVEEEHEGCSENVQHQPQNQLQSGRKGLASVDGAKHGAVRGIPNDKMGRRNDAHRSRCTGSHTWASTPKCLHFHPGVSGSD